MDPRQRQRPLPVRARARPARLRDVARGTRRLRAQRRARRRRASGSRRRPAGRRHPRGVRDAAGRGRRRDARVSRARPRAQVPRAARRVRRRRRCARRQARAVRLARAVPGRRQLVQGPARTVGEVVGRVRRRSGGDTLQPARRVRVARGRARRRPAGGARRLRRRRPSDRLLARAADRRRERRGHVHVRPPHPDAVRRRPRADGRRAAAAGDARRRVPRDRQGIPVLRRAVVGGLRGLPVPVGPRRRRRRLGQAPDRLRGGVQPSAGAPRLDRRRGTARDGGSRRGGGRERVRRDAQEVPRGVTRRAAVQEDHKDPLAVGPADERELLPRDHRLGLGRLVPDRGALAAYPRPRRPEGAARRRGLAPHSLLYGARRLRVGRRAVRRALRVPRRAGEMKRGSVLFSRFYLYSVPPNLHIGGA